MNELLNGLRDSLKDKKFKNPNLAFGADSEPDVLNRNYNNAVIKTAQSMCKRKFNIGKK